MSDTYECNYCGNTRWENEDPAVEVCRGGNRVVMCRECRLAYSIKHLTADECKALRDRHNVEACPDTLQISKDGVSWQPLEIEDLAQIALDRINVGGTHG